MTGPRLITDADDDLILSNTAEAVAALQAIYRDLRDLERQHAEPPALSLGLRTQVYVLALMAGDILDLAAGFPTGSE